MREYGGYIEFEYYHGKEYHENAIALNSGRHCVEYLIRAKNIQKLYLPYFMCDSVKTLCDKLNVEISYYHTDINFVPLIENTFSGDEWLYIVNYYGQLSNTTMEAYKLKYGNIIIDNVQTFFQKPVDGIDTTYTCRKFFGVADGGYLYTDQTLEDALEQDYSYNRIEFLFGRMEKSANEFYAQYTANNKLFATEPLKRMSKLTQNILRSLDYESIKTIRTANFSYLHDKLKGINKLDLIVPDGAFMYPLYIENGAEIRKKLQQKKIYIPTLWPDVFDICEETDLEYDMAKNILPLPVDQRYGLDDMEYLVKCILATKEVI